MEIINFDLATKWNKFSFNKIIKTDWNYLKKDLNLKNLNR